MKSKAFAIRIFNLCRHLQAKEHEYVVTQQICKSGTSIGANIAESKFASSTADFINKLRISLKEANETLYWLELLEATGTIDKALYNSLSSDCNELIYILISIINSSENNGIAK